MTRHTRNSLRLLNLLTFALMVVLLFMTGLAQYLFLGLPLAFISKWLDKKINSL